MKNKPEAHARHIIISGGSRGLGKAIVTELLKAGYRVSTFSRNKTEFVEQLSSEKNFFFAPADLASASSLREFVRSAEKMHGPPYGLINCAAIAADGILATTSEKTIDELAVVNVEGTLKLTRFVVRRMLLSPAGGVILNISTISALRGYKGLSVYAFTKGGIDSFTRALARELGEHKIRVNSIAPGYYDTEMSQGLTEKHKQQILRRTPLGRLGVPEDVTGAVLFFLSDQASFITGQVLVIDGGSIV
jgi:3-oxoacyl-[acyl-carrier protein] reductase